MRAIFFDCPSFLAELYDDELRAIVPDLAMTVDDVPGDDVAAYVGDAVGDHQRPYLHDRRRCLPPAARSR